MPDLAALSRLDAVAQADLVRRGKVTPRELVDAAIARIEAMNPLVHAVVAEDFERARARADRELEGPLAGVPFLVKDVVAYPGARFSMGARLFAKNVATEGSPFTERLDAAGLVVLGKTATSELGLLGSTETLLEGITHNPWDLSVSAAGSSGGAAAAVASGMVPMAHASDAGGSIRIPASVTGLFGFKPSKGRGVPTSAVSNDFADLVQDLSISRSVRDAAALLAATEARGERAAFPPIGVVQGPSTKRLRVATFSRTLMGAEPSAEVRKALDDARALVKALGHEVVEIAPPAIDGAALSDAFFTSAGAAISGLAKMLGGMLGRALDRRDLEPFTLELVARFDAGPPDAAAIAHAALTTAAKAYLDLASAWDCVLTPTLAVEPWPLGWLAPWRSRDELLRRTERAVGYTPIHNIAGCPAMNVPLGWSDADLPIGVCFAASPGEDRALLELAFELEAARPWKDRWAPCSYAALFGV